MLWSRRLSKLSTLHGTVDDDKMQVAERCKQVQVDLKPLSSLVNDLLSLARLQVDLCQASSSSSPSSLSSLGTGPAPSVQAVQAELKSTLDLIVHSSSRISALLQQFRHWLLFHAGIYSYILTAQMQRMGLSWLISYLHWWSILSIYLGQLIGTHPSLFRFAYIWHSVCNIRYTVYRMDQMANEVFALAKAVSEATSTTIA